MPECDCECHNNPNILHIDACCDGECEGCKLPQNNLKEHRKDCPAFEVWKINRSKVFYAREVSMNSRREFMKMTALGLSGLAAGISSANELSPAKYIGKIERIPLNEADVIYKISERQLDGTYSRMEYGFQKGPGYTNIEDALLEAQHIAGLANGWGPRDNSDLQTEKLILQYVTFLGPNV